jgi:hypothetical protein
VLTAKKSELQLEVAGGVAGLVVIGTLVLLLLWRTIKNRQPQLDPSELGPSAHSENVDRVQTPMVSPGSPVFSPGAEQVNVRGATFIHVT